MNNTISNTPYDDVYRTMLVEDDELVLPLLNEVFGENYTGEERIVRFSNEHYDIQQGGAGDKRITDSFLEVIGQERKRYHCECESSPDGSIIIRMFQYGTQLALVDSVFNGNRLRVSFPQAAVIFLRSHSNTPDKMEIEIVTPGGSVSYEVETLKISSYGIRDIFKKKLYFLLPFYIFNLEKKLREYESNPIKRAELSRLYVLIYKRLEKLVLKKQLTAFSLHLIMDLSNKVVQNLAERYEHVRKDLGGIMGGQVLDLPIIRVRKEALKDYDEMKKRLDETNKKVEEVNKKLDEAIAREAEQKDRAEKAENRAEEAESRIRILEKMVKRMESAGNFQKIEKDV